MALAKSEALPSFHLGLLNRDYIGPTTDKEWLGQYFKIRKQVFLEEVKSGLTGVNDYSKDSSLDLNSEIIVVVKDGVCVGGTRFTIVPQQSNQLLPMEIHNFRLKNYLPELHFHSYAELSALALLPEYRTCDYIDSIVKCANKIAAERKVRYIFAKATAVRARNFRRSYSRLGTALKIRGDIPIPTFSESNIKRYLVIQDLY